MTDTTHNLEAGDELIDSTEDATLLVEDVHDDGSVTWVTLGEEGGQQVQYNDTRQTMSEADVITGLEEGIVTRA